MDYRLSKIYHPPARVKGAVVAHTVFSRCVSIAYPARACSRVFIPQPFTLEMTYLQMFLTTSYDLSSPTIIYMTVYSKRLFPTTAVKAVHFHCSELEGALAVTVSDHIRTPQRIIDVL
ncbi:hypothetical protein EVAR_100800_1 [Eumeta japonica]|uniref:Uncharacterized protein n=1 Tax=Eumeta variegata TaxID=151549 RepID=A0A4C2A4Q3_EUMVA|nr:hypothetical protein EVAR_100800_1 [Eumeta japonica]